MAISKKYSRPITVDGVVYRWRIPPEVEYDQTDHDGRVLVIVWRETETGQLLRLIGGLHPAYRHRRPDGCDIVTPHRVATAIRSALVAGWNPAGRGTAFRMTLPPMDA